MSLSASMWTGVSGLLGHGEKMNVVGNNIANVSTVGFKGQRMDFEDFMYATTHSASGPAQIGRGVNIGVIMGDFNQGSFESTTSPVDLAIGGAGFFKVQRKGTEEAFYTRAGNFRFDVDGYLADPHGYAVQGWKIDNTTGPTRAAGGAGASADKSSGIRGSGVPIDVRLDSWTVPPKQTTKTSVITNLSANGADSSKNSGNPFVSLIQSWDGTQPPANSATPAIAEVSYSYSTSIKVYDESGLSHTMTVYYDKVDPESYDSDESGTMWEYMVTMDPSEDKRQVWDDATGTLVDMKTTKGAGLLMSGVMTFSPGGEMTNQTAYTLMGGIPHAVDTAGNPIADANYTWADPLNHSKGLVPKVSGVTDLADITSNYYPAAVSQTGYPMLVANFGGVPSANTAGSPKGESYLMELNLGMKVADFNNPWKVSDTTPLSQATNVPLNGGRLVQNEYRQGASNSTKGPKIVETNTGCHRPLYDEYMEKVINGTETYAAFTARKELEINPATGVLFTGPEVINSTWLYQTTPAGAMGAPFTNTDAEKQLFTDFTPHTNDIGFINGTTKPDANSTKMLGTNYATANGTGQNGYTFGNLTGYDVDAEGVLYGVYSNGVTMGLYQLTLYDFTSHQGLRREGGNLFSQTMESGEAFFGAPQTNGMGKINSYSLEQSNVDMSREFVQMISTQRGFQANSKVVTTTDTMLETVVNMKR